METEIAGRGIAHEHVQVAAPSLQLPSYARCAIVLATITLALRTRGFVWTFRATRRRTARGRPPAHPPHATVEDVARRVATVAALWPGRAKCLEQSLTLYACLRLLDVPAELRIGVQPISFAAHAWVEYRGMPVLEAEMIHTVVPFRALPL